MKNNDETVVEGKIQRYCIGFLLPFILTVLWLNYEMKNMPTYHMSFHHMSLIGLVVVSLIFFGIPLIILSIITEKLQKENTFLFIVFSFLLAFAPMIILFFIIFFYALGWLFVIPSWILTIIILRCHYLYYKKNEIIEISYF